MWRPLALYGASIRINRQSTKKILQYYTFRAPSVSPLIPSKKKTSHSLAVIQPLGSFFPLGTPPSLLIAVPAEVPTKQNCLTL